MAAPLPRLSHAPPPNTAPQTPSPAAKRNADPSPKPPAAPPTPPGAFAYNTPAADYSRVYKYITDPSPENAKAADVRGFYRQLFKDQFSYEANAGNADCYGRGRMVVELKGRNDDGLAGLLPGAALRQKGAGLCLRHGAGRQLHRPVAGDQDSGVCQAAGHQPERAAVEAVRQNICESLGARE